MSVFENLYASKHVKRQKACRKSADATGQVRRSKGMKLLSSRKATLQPLATLFFQVSCVDLLIQFFTLLALLRACKKLVNDKGSQGVWRPSASGQGSLHSVLPLIRPLRFFYPILP